MKRTFETAPGLTAKKDGTHFPWTVTRDSDNKYLGYMIRKQRNKGWHSAYWRITPAGLHKASSDFYGNMDRAMRELEDMAV